MQQELYDAIVISVCQSASDLLADGEINNSSAQRVIQVIMESKPNPHDASKQAQLDPNNLAVAVGICAVCIFSHYNSNISSRGEAENSFMALVDAGKISLSKSTD
jgi:hypothetical protein